jgi:ribose 1,5-bisphosphokinase
VATRQSTARGTLILIVGPSGVGKDSLIAYCRERLAASDAVVFPRRAITRPMNDASEEHDTIPEDAFRDRAGNGGFALHWQAHGLGYGIPLSIANDLAAHRSVVVNVSRAVIGEARLRFQPLTIVSVVAPPDILAKRLHHRGREPGDLIPARLARAVEYEVSGPDVIHLDNSGPVEIAGEQLLALLRRTVL